MNGVEPILVIFDDPKEKEIVWSKLRDNLQVTLTFDLLKLTFQTIGLFFYRPRPMWW